MSPRYGPPPHDRLKAEVLCVLGDSDDADDA